MESGLKKHFLSKLSIGVWIRLLRANNLLAGEIRKKIGSKGVTLPQLYVLATLMVLGDLTLGELGKQILVSKGNITPIVDNLEKYGYVVRDRDPKDRRIIWVRLTNKGDDLIKEIITHHEGELVTMLSRLSHPELKQLSHLLKKLTDGITKN
ncbi:MAG: MarR family transcriptional regulator [Thermodesulfobacteriota bacterium]|nr:MarR family transcriptional regulator [Thermodesulfobacteriota bacterium]